MNFNIGSSLAQKVIEKQQSLKYSHPFYAATILPLIVLKQKVEKATE